MLEENKFALAITAQANPDGDLHNPETAPKPHSSAKLYKSLFVRHWDTYITPNRSAIWLGVISRPSPKTHSYAQYSLSPLVNALKGTALESPVPPFGGSDHFDISSSGLIFVAKDPDLNPATHTKVNVYLIPTTNFLDSALPSPKKIDIFGFEGASTAPVFSPDGKQAAFLSMRKDGYESDKNQLFVVPDIRRPSWVIHAFASEDRKGKWDRSPQTIAWSRDGKQLYLLAEDKGRVCLFSVPSVDLIKASLPQLIFNSGTITGEKYS